MNAQGEIAAIRITWLSALLSDRKPGSMEPGFPWPKSAARNTARIPREKTQLSPVISQTAAFRLRTHSAAVSRIAAIVSSVSPR